MVNNRETHQLQLLHRATLAFNASLDLNDIFHTILDEISHALRAKGWAVWGLDDKGENLVCQQAAGVGAESLIGYRVSIDPSNTSLPAVVARTGTSIYLPDTSQDPRFNKHIETQRGLTVRSMIVAPLSSRELDDKLTPIGLIVVISDIANAFTEDDCTLIDALAASAAIAIRNGRLYQRARTEIEERRRAEAALRESESHYRTLIETSPDAVVSVDLNGHIQMCNRRALQLYGYQHSAQLLGRSYLTLFPPESRFRAIQGFDLVVQGTALKNEETTLLRADGSLFYGEIAAALAADSTGEPANIVGFARDITDRKEAETAMRQHNEELRVLNSIATQITQTQDLEQLLKISLDKTLDALKVDTGWITLFSTENCPKTAADIQIHICRGMLAEAGVKTRNEKLCWEIDEQVCRSRRLVVHKTTDFLQIHAGMATTCPVIGMPLTVNETVIGVLGVIGLSNRNPRNIYARQEQLLSAISYQISIAIENAKLAAEAAEVKILREIERVRSELIANFSHDLRSPLGLIEMTTSTLLRDDLEIDAALQNELLNDVIAQTKRLSHLVEGVLDMGRIENGHLELHPVPVNVKQLLSQVSKDMSSRYSCHRFELDFPGDPLLALADAYRLEQVLYNLLDNAAKYSPKGGEIRATASQCEDNIIIHIQDNGIGIPKDQLQLIFERFYRVQDTAAEEISGVGLGLSICKGIIEAHGGHLWVESTYGEGSTFGFTLPAVPDLTTENKGTTR